MGECRNLGRTPSTLQHQGQLGDLKLDVRIYREGLGKAGAVPSLDKGFTALYVPRMCAHKAKDLPDLQTSRSAASWTLLLSLTRRELSDNLAIKIIRKLTRA